MSGFNFYPDESPAIRTLLLHRDELANDIRSAESNLIRLRSQTADLDEKIKSMSMDIELVDTAINDLRRSKVSHDNVLNSVLNGYMP